MTGSADPYGEYEQSFVKVSENEDSNGFMELPKEDDGSLLLSTVTGQFPDAVGLKYKSSSGAWRGIRISENVMDPPAAGWGNTLFYITLQRSESNKRKVEESLKEEPAPKSAKSKELLEDIIVLGLPFTCTDVDLKDYFTNECGELAFHELKHDRNTGKPRGFGFIRFKTVEGAKKALNNEHCMNGRTLEIRLSKKKEFPLKLFVGRIPNGVSQEDLKTYFADYGVITDSYIPAPFRGFGFVTFESAEEARLALRVNHNIRGVRMNVMLAEDKGDKGGRGREYRPPRESHDDRPQRESRDNRGPREGREERAQRHNFDDRGREEGGREVRDGRTERTSRDSNRGPRDFRDSVERNPMDRSVVDRTNLVDRDFRDRDVGEDPRDTRDKNQRGGRDTRERRNSREKNLPDREQRERNRRGSRDRDQRDIRQMELRSGGERSFGRDQRDTTRDRRDTTRDQRDTTRDQRENTRDQRENTRDQRENTRDQRDIRGLQESNRDLREDIGRQQQRANDNREQQLAFLEGRDYRSPQEKTDYRQPKDSRVGTDQQTQHQHNRFEQRQQVNQQYGGGGGGGGFSNMQQKQQMQLPPGGVPPNVATELKNMIYQFLGSN